MKTFEALMKVISLSQKQKSNSPSNSPYPHRSILYTNPQN